MTFNGTSLTLANNPTLSGGTANSVQYLNASKVLTSSAGLTFDGTNLATTGTASATKFIPTGGAATGSGMFLPVANNLAFSTGSVERMRIDASGNVGIGTTTPATYRLSVTGLSPIVAVQDTAPNLSALLLASSNTEVYVGTTYATSAIPLVFKLFGAECARFSTAANFGIGVTSPSVRCDVNGAIRTRATVVTSLPAAATAGAGARHFVTDANATTFASVVAGGGANGVPVYSDGTDWRIG